MAKLNISHAAKAAGIARRTLQRHIEKGKVSYETGKHGRKLIDTAELIRVYGDLKARGTDGAMRQAGHVAQQTAPDDAPEIFLLRQQVAMLEKQLDESKRDKDRLLTIVEQQTHLLTHQPIKHRSLWHWFRFSKQPI